MVEKSLETITEKEFDSLKAMGWLWEIYPDAPEFFREIKGGVEKGFFEESDNEGI